ncbi:MAG: toxic anion resistance protein [Lachnospiraceae bacterium]|nr:toxic anion resistance protein [Candidatus Equihabitans merdae]
MAEAPAPSLSFGAAPEPEAVQVAEPEKPKAAVIDDSMLTEAEKKQVIDFSKQINLGDTNAILQYGAGTQQKMSAFSDSALASVKTKELGEVGDMLTNVVSTLKDFDPNAKEEKGLFGVFKKGGRKIDDLKVKYDEAAKNVDRVVEALQKHQITLMKDVAMLDKMYASNLTYYKELTMYILAGKRRLEDFRVNELAQAKAKAEQSGLAEDAQYARDLEEQALRFEKKLHDLELTRMVSIQTAPQIRMIQSNDTTMVEKIQSTLVNTIPLWKNQMVLAMGIENSTRAAEAENAVTEMTNELLNRNAETLKQATIATAQASERGVVDMETLKHTNETLIATLDEVAKIQTEGREKRAAAEVELRRLEDELKDKLLTMQKS